MNRFHRGLLRYLTWGFIPVLAVFILDPIDDYFQLSGVPSGVDILFNILGINIVFWFITVIYFSIYLMTSSQARNSFLSKIAGIHERDEREDQIASQAAKFSFLANLAFLGLLFFLSIVSFNITVQEQSSSATMSVSFAVLSNDSAPELQSKTDSSPIKWQINYPGLPLTLSGIIILLLLWQCLTYHYFARRALRE